MINELKGEWLLSPEYDQADLIIFRSDNVYLIYNELDYEGLEPEKHQYNVCFDDNITRTAIVETGKWSYNNSSQELILTNRNFIKEHSEFNNLYGKGNKLTFFVKELADNKLNLCSVEKENSCDIYINNANYSGNKDKVFYKEVSKKISDTGNQVKEILLSGYETELRLTYEFSKGPDRLTIEDKNGRVLFSADTITASERKTAEIPLKGITRLVFRIDNKQVNSKWEIMAEIK